MAKKNPFSPDYAPYGTYKGEPGSPDQWKSAYDTRMGSQEAKTHLADDSPYIILGIEEGSSWAQIKAAYRKLVFTVHPDHGGTSEAFKKVHAAYSILMEQFDE